MFKTLGKLIAQPTIDSMGTKIASDFVNDSVSRGMALYVQMRYANPEPDSAEVFNDLESYGDASDKVIADIANLSAETIYLLVALKKNPDCLNEAVQGTQMPRDILRNAMRASFCDFIDFAKSSEEWAEYTHGCVFDICKSGLLLAAELPIFAQESGGYISFIRAANQQIGDKTPHLLHQALVHDFDRIWRTLNDAADAFNTPSHPFASLTPAAPRGAQELKQ